MTIGEKIRQARIAKGLTQEELAEKLGYKSRSSINKIETGGRDVPRSQLKKIAEILDVSPISLLGFEEEEKEETYLMGEEPNQEIEQMNSVYMRPVFDSVSAGFGAYASNDIIGYTPVIIDNPHDVDDTICIKVRGNSMYPKIEEGDTIVVRKQDAVDDGRIAVVLIGDDAVVKKVEFGKDCLTLISINPEYPPRTIEGPELENVRIVGLVRQVIKAV